MNALEEIVDAIDSSPDPSIRDNTIIVVTSDHGWNMGEKDYLFKNSPWGGEHPRPLHYSRTWFERTRYALPTTNFIDRFVSNTNLIYVRSRGIHVKTSKGQNWTATASAH